MPWACPRPACRSRPKRGHRLRCTRSCRCASTAPARSRTPRAGGGGSVRAAHRRGRRGAEGGACRAVGVLARGRLAAAVQAQDVAAVQRIPGVGKKTASRIILELKGSFDEGLASLFDGGGARSGVGCESCRHARGAAVDGLHVRRGRRRPQGAPRRRVRGRAATICAEAYQVLAGTADRRNGSDAAAFRSTPIPRRSKLPPRVRSTLRRAFTSISGTAKSLADIVGPGEGDNA